MFVVDASMTLAWCLPDEASAYTERVLDQLRRETALVPAIWPLEVANALLVVERRQRLTEAQRIVVIRQLQALPIAVSNVNAGQALGPVMDLAREQRLSSYDAAYV